MEFNDFFLIVVLFLFFVLFLLCLGFFIGFVCELFLVGFIFFLILELVWNCGKGVGFFFLGIKFFCLRVGEDLVECDLVIVSMFMLESFVGILGIILLIFLEFSDVFFFCFILGIVVFVFLVFGVLDLVDWGFDF